MQNVTHQELYGRFFQAKHSVKIYVGKLADDELFTECVSLMNRKVAVDLFLSHAVCENIQAEPFLMSRIYLLREQGASIYTAPEFEKDTVYIAQIDYIRSIEIRYPWKALVSYGKSDIIFKKYRAKFEEIERQELEFLADAEDIKIHFMCDGAHAVKNSAVQLNWRVVNADVVEIEGVGEVSSTGSLSVTLLADTLIKISASRQKRKIRKCFAINTIEELKFDYDLQYLNPYSRKYYSLKEPNSDGVFGVVKGSKLKLIWNADTADKLSIRPFELTGKSGEHVFSIDNFIEISIQMIHHSGRTLSNRIIIQEFPVRVFDGSYISIKPEYLKAIEFNLTDLRYQAYDYLTEKGLIDFRAKTSDLQRKFIKLDKRLHKWYQSSDFRSFYRQNSLAVLNKSVVGRLRHYFKDNPSVLEMINVMPKHHEGG